MDWVGMPWNCKNLQSFLYCCISSSLCCSISNPLNVRSGEVVCFFGLITITRHCDGMCVMMASVDVLVWMCCWFWLGTLVWADGRSMSGGPKHHQHGGSDVGGLVGGCPW